MVPPDALFGQIPTWAGVYVGTAVAFGFAALLLYHRVFELVLLGKPSHRFDRPLRRLFESVPLVLGQQKVLQSVSVRRDRAGLAHVFIFWGFLSFTASYLIFIFGDSVWRPFSSRLLTDAGIKVFATYIDLLAVAFLVVLAWAALRRWVARPQRLSFDLTLRWESAIILVLIAMLMVFALLSEAFHVAAGGAGPTTSAPVGSMLGRLFRDAGIDGSLVEGLHAVSWWGHLSLILGFSLYIPLSTHVHLIASPLSFVLRSREAAGTLRTPDDLETAERFGAGRLQDFTSKELLDGFACAVCGRCTDACPANMTGKTLSPMHVIEDLRQYVVTMGPNVVRGADEQESNALIGPVIGQEALWDCLTCGACEQVCPAGVEHIDAIVDMRRHLVMDRAEMPETGENALMSMEQRGHPWRGTPYSRTDWAEGLGVKTLAEHPQAEVLMWVGCTAALEKRSQRIARAMASVLKRAGVDFRHPGVRGDVHR